MPPVLPDTSATDKLTRWFSLFADCEWNCCAYVVTLCCKKRKGDGKMCCVYTQRFTQGDHLRVRDMHRPAEPAPGYVFQDVPHVMVYLEHSDS
ncbi:hypothetical protein J6590_006809 [Homalodisca vitripennis]|nr:hypothetical protein J6590_006809 [Homalodisca vitripennis]